MANDFDARLAEALKRLNATGIRRSSYAPPLYRGLWQVGFRICPPHFSPFPTNALVTGAGSAVFAALICALAAPLVPQYRIITQLVFERPIAYLLLFAGFGALVGLAAAIYYWLSARRHRLPSWNDLPVEE